MEVHNKNKWRFPMKAIRLLVPAFLAVILFLLPAAGSAAVLVRHGWVQVNAGGFGDIQSISVSALCEYEGVLYAGTYNLREGPSIWRYLGGKNWERVIHLEDSTTGGNLAVTSMVVFKERLYATTSWGMNSARVWRFDGTTWEIVLERPVNGFTALAVFNDQIYAGASVLESAGGTIILRSSSGDSSSWIEVVSAGNGDAKSYAITNLAVFNSSIYAAVANETKGVQVWRSSNGADGTWSVEVSDGFGSAANTDPGSFTVHNNHLYLGMRSGPFIVTDPAQSGGGKFYRSTNGTQWTPVTVNGFGDPHNVKIEGMIAFQGVLYAFTSNPFHGMQVWRSHDDGASWQRDAANGFNSAFNRNTLWNSALVIFNNSLYVGTSNYNYDQTFNYRAEEGGQVWRWTVFDHVVYLPGIRR
jgi:hypothetical protein